MNQSKLNLSILPGFLAFLITMLLNLGGCTQAVNYQGGNVTESVDSVAEADTVTIDSCQLKKEMLLNKMREDIEEAFPTDRFYVVDYRTEYYIEIDKVTGVLYKSTHFTWGNGGYASTTVLFDTTGKPLRYEIDPSVFE